MDNDDDSANQTVSHTITGTSQSLVPAPHANHPNTVLGPFVFTNFPLEIQCMIMQYCDLSWRPRFATDGDPDRSTAMPALVGALRCLALAGPFHARSYSEALQLFYRLNTYIVSSGTGDGFGWMKRCAVETIQSVAIPYSSFAPAFIKDPSRPHRIRFNIPTLRNLEIDQLLPTIQEIHFYHDGRRTLPGMRHELDLIITQNQFHNYLPRFTRLVRVSCEIFTENRHRINVMLNPAAVYSSKNEERIRQRGPRTGENPVLISFEQRNSQCPVPRADSIYSVVRPPMLYETPYWYETWEWTAEGKSMQW